MTAVIPQSTELQHQDKRDIIIAKSINKNQHQKNDLLNISRINPHRKDD